MGLKSGTLKVFFLLAIVALVGAGDLFVAVQQSPQMQEAGSELGDMSVNLEALSESTQTLLLKGEVQEVDLTQKEVRVSYLSQENSIELVDGMFVGEGSADSFNESDSECYEQVVSEGEVYVEERFVGSSVQVLPVDVDNGSEKIQSGRLYLEEENTTFAYEVVLEGYGQFEPSSENVSDGERRPPEFWAAQLEAQEADRGVWRCVPEDAEPDIESLAAEAE